MDIYNIYYYIYVYIYMYIYIYYILIYIWCEKVSIRARIILYQMYANVTLQTDLAQHDVHALTT